MVKFKGSDERSWPGEVSRTSGSNVGQCSWAAQVAAAVEVGAFRWKCADWRLFSEPVGEFQSTDGSVQSPRMTEDPIKYAWGRFVRQGNKGGTRGNIFLSQWAATQMISGVSFILFVSLLCLQRVRRRNQTKAHITGWSDTNVYKQVRLAAAQLCWRLAIQCDILQFISKEETHIGFIFHTGFVADALHVGIVTLSIRSSFTRSASPCSNSLHIQKWHSDSRVKTRLTSHVVKVFRAAASILKHFTLCMCASVA